MEALHFQTSQPLRRTSFSLFPTCPHTSGSGKQTEWVHMFKCIVVIWSPCHSWQLISFIESHLRDADDWNNYLIEMLRRQKKVKSENLTFIKIMFKRFPVAWLPSDKIIAWVHARLSGRQSSRAPAGWGELQEQLLWLPGVKGAFKVILPRHTLNFLKLRINFLKK